MTSICSYSIELAALNRIMRSGFRPENHVIDIMEFLRNTNLNLVKYYEGKDEINIAQEWFKKADQQDIAFCLNWIATNKYRDVRCRAPYFDMNYIKPIKNEWLIHFTDSPLSIRAYGFIYGHPEFKGLQLTTGKEKRKERPGYNFAYLTNNVEDKTFEIVDKERKMWSDQKIFFDRHAVIFKGSGLQIFHKLDKEEQIIFHGLSVDNNKIYPITQDDEFKYWCIKSGYVGAAKSKVIKKGSVQECVDWIKNNYQMLDNIVRKQKESLNEERINSLSFN